MLSGYEKFPKYLLDFSYILFDVNRYNEDARRLRKLTGILKEMTQDEFRQIVTWLKHAVRPKIPEYLQEEVDRFFEVSNPWEVETMISNLELTLEEMKREALREAKREAEWKV